MPMVRALTAGRFLTAALLFAACAMAGAQTANAPTPSTQANSQAPPQTQSSTADRTQPQDQDSSSSKTRHHTIRVAEEGAPRPELAKAEDLIQKQDYAAAEPLLRQVTESEPANYEAWFDLGFVENGLGKVDGSIAAYRKAVAAKPDVFESNLNLGLQLAKTGQPEAEQFLRAATQLKPTANVSEGRARAWLSLGHVLEQTKPQDALAAYQQAAALQPKDPEPHVAGGLLLEKENKFSDAENEYKQALALEPASDSSSDAFVGLANIYMRGRRFPEAEEFLRKLVAARPEDAAAHIQLGRVLAEEGKNDDALAEFQAGVKLAPPDRTVQRELASLYGTAGRNDQAEGLLRELLVSDPNDAELHDELGQALLQQKKIAPAQQEFLTAVKLKPDLGKAYFDLAFAAGENKDYALALKALDARAKFSPEGPITYFLRASAYDHLKDFKRAAANYHLFLNTANGQYPDQEWQARHRLVAIEPKK